MKRWAMMIAMWPWLALAQATPADMQQIQQGLNDPAMMQRIMEMAKTQTIDISQHRDRIRTDCDESRFLSCQAGYRCNTTGSSGASSLATVHGKKSGRCHVTMQNNDGSNGICHYTQATMNQMMRIYRATTISVAEAMQAGQNMMQECQFTDAQGKPFAMPVIR